MKIVRRAKEPQPYCINSMASNLASKFGDSNQSCLIGIDYWYHPSRPLLRCKISFVPGFGEDCTHFSFFFLARITR